jgi:hypothetical protein
MDTSNRVAAARDQLNRTLSFFPRVDAKASVVLAVDTSMLALLATRAFPHANMGWAWIPAVLALICLGASLWNVYKEGFPSLGGGEESLLYFREIAKRTEASYVVAWTQLDDEQYTRDLLGQVWRNSVILRQKFNHVRLALVWLSLGIPVWLGALGLLVFSRAAQ